MATVKKQSTKTTAAKAKPTKAGAEAPPTAAEIKAWRAASKKVDVRVEILTGTGIQTVAGNATIPAGRWFAAVPLAPPDRRYQYVLQWQGPSKKFVLVHLVDGAGAQRLPPANGWSRALDTGKLHVISSDLQLSRRQLAAILGGHEPPTGTAKPPNT
jgi:hypothetical protein